ncbi:MAG: aspartate carbamoyltransferase catalytic subunit [Acidobacteria bacterium]|nr:aspartate carbamoyltransferase catalytic subunit [Acidobacteriota bacterium]
MPLKRKDLLGIKELSPEEISLILDTAKAFKEISTREVKKVPALRGKTVVTLFLEPSTRTRTSFEIASKRLSADTLNIAAASSSILKGETLVDTAKNLEAMYPDIIILRHSAPGAPHLLAKICRASIVNAGDGANEHPTQALLDAFTIREKKGKLSGLRVAIIGDISHSRVARSNIHLLTKMGAEVVVAGPPTYIPPEIEKLGVKVHIKIEEAVRGCDVIMMLRVQLERQDKSFIPSLAEYSRLFQLTPERVKLAKKDVIIMHPGPINRGVELSAEVADGSYSVILEQVTNGVAVRMAILYLLSGGRYEEVAH